MSSSPAASTGPTDLRPLSIMVGAMAGGLVVMALVLWLIGADLEAPSAWTLLVVGVATVCAWALVLVMPVARGPGGTPTAALVTPTVVFRAAVLEAPAILGLILFFVDRQTLLIFALPALFSIAGMWLFARPTVVARRINRVA
ncbi:hypothetical protein [Serinicoccus kebangsaanensis]|uniref:hypothetical protein n=1 Tax=Serinicoccus kebangsaanensis TaxID=2602069 RepID=UPI00124D8CEB|nr:hypothetical protein [Serinicoccus kebangsaanensis]